MTTSINEAQPRGLCGKRDGPRKWAIGLAFSFAVVLSLWIRAAFLPFGLWGMLDDVLFLRLAESLLQGDWLGPFDNTVLVKGAFFPLFLAANHALGLPLKFSEHSLFLIASLLASASLARAAGRTWVGLTTFFVLAFCPALWTEHAARATRETLYLTLSLLLVLTLTIYLENPRRRAIGVGAGLVGGCYWLTREEGIWLVPTIAVLALAFLLERRDHNGAVPAESRAGTVMAKIAVLAVPFAAFLLPVIAVNSINYFSYGVFRNNDVRSGPFQEAYGALARIHHERPKRFVIFPRDARQHAYSVSSAARELKFFFEGDPGANWAAASRIYPAPWGCAHAPQTCNDEILSAWFMWAFRDAVLAAGHYRSAESADTFYRRLASEINAACERGDIPCGARRASLVPVLGEGDPTRIAESTWRILGLLATFGNGRIGVRSSPLSIEQAQYFRKMTRSQISGFGKGGERSETYNPNHTRVRLATAIADTFAFLSPPIFCLSLAGYAYLLALAARRAAPEGSRWARVLLTALLVAVVTRVGLLGFLDATAIPSRSLLYLLPVVPFYLMFVVLALALSGRALLDRRRARVARRAAQDRC